MLIALVASAVGEWPNGVHWTPEETRAVRVDDEDEIPIWLTESVSVSVSVSVSAPVRADGGVLPVVDVDERPSALNAEQGRPSALNAESG